jgi:adenylosuccinate lyase
MRLAVHMGKREAHARVEEASRRVVAEGRTLAAVLAEDSAVAAVLDRETLHQLLAPEAYLGAASTFIASALAQAEEDGG